MATDTITTTPHEPLAPAIAPTSPVPMVVAPAPVQGLFRMSVAQYEAMGAAGILRDGDPVELIEGLLVRKITKGDRHHSVVTKISRAFARQLPDGWLSTSEGPVILDRSEPEPDLTVYRGRDDEPVIRRPGPDRVGLVIEIADTSYASDAARIPMFAEVGIPTYWIIHIPAGRIEVYTDPTGADPAPTYRRRHDYVPGTRVPVVLDGALAFELAVDALLPPKS